MLTSGCSAATQEVGVNAKDKVDGSTALMLAALHDSAEVVQLLLVNRARPDIQNGDGSGDLCADRLTRPPANGTGHRAPEPKESSAA